MLVLQLASLTLIIQSMYAAVYQNAIFPRISDLELPVTGEMMWGSTLEITYGQRQHFFLNTVGTNAGTSERNSKSALIQISDIMIWV